MKRIMSLVLLSTMLLSLLGACGTAAPASAAESAAAQETVEAPAETEEPSAAEEIMEPEAATEETGDDAGTENQEPAVIPEEEKEEETVAEKVPADDTEEAAAETTVPSELLGTLTDTSYVNDYFGLRYDAPANWYILSRDETVAIMGIVASNVDDEALVEIFENTGYVIDLNAMDTIPAIEGADAHNSVNITIQDIGKIYGMILDEKRLAEVSAESVRESLEALGLTDITMEIGETEFIGKTCVVSALTGKTGDIDMYQKQVYLKNGSAVACITATTSGEDKTDEILSAFYGSTEMGTDADATVSDAAIADAELASGTISIDGDLFTLGTSFNEVQGGWALKPEDAEKYKDYSLNPRTTSGTAMGIYKDEFGYEFTSFHVMVSLMNESEAPIAYLDGAIDYLSIPGIQRAETVPPVVFPGGLTLESTEEEFIAAYGEPTYQYEDESTEFKTLKFQNGEVELEVIWSKGMIDEITLMI